MKVHELFPYFDGVMNEVRQNLELAPGGTEIDERQVAKDVIFDFGEFPDEASLDKMDRLVEEALDEYYGLMPMVQGVGDD